MSVWRGGDRYEPKEDEEPRPRRGKDPRQHAWELILRDQELLTRLNRHLAPTGLTIADLQGTTVR